MKKLFAFALCAMMVAASATAQKSALLFDAYEWDFGTVNAAAGAVCHSFTLKNKSDADVKVSEVKPSCECISAIVPEGIIAPAEQAEVLVVFRPAKSVGKSFRSVELLDANGKTLGALSIKAMVKEGTVVMSI